MQNSTMDENMTMETSSDSTFGNEEADITMIFYVLKAANNGKGVIRVLTRRYKVAE